MSRAENRRKKREEKHKKATLNMTAGSLSTVKDNATYEAVTQAMTLLMSIPLKICHEKLGWNESECAWFADEIEKEYQSFADRHTSLKDYADEAYDLVGVKFVEIER